MTPGEPSSGPRREKVDLREFRALFRRSRTGAGGGADQRGALNDLTPERVVAAARLVRTGETVTLGLPLNTRTASTTPCPPSTG